MRPNPWVAIPTLLAFLFGGFMGFILTQAGCDPPGCLVLASAVGVVSAILIGAGVLVVVVLAVRSFEEHRERERRQER